MNAERAAEAYMSLYGPTSEELRRMLPDLAESLHDRLCELSVRPTADGAERMLASLASAHTCIAKLRDALEREGGGNGR